LTYIIRPDVDEEAAAAVAARMEQTISTNGGRVLKTDSWGKRRLAYPIRRYSEGYYILLLTELNDKAIREVERQMKLSEDIIRHLLVRVESAEAPAPEVAGPPAQVAAAEPTGQVAAAEPTGQVAAAEAEEPAPPAEPEETE